MTISTANVATEHASSYLRQLCRHWAHRFPVQFDEVNGRVEMPSAVCALEAQPAVLHVRLQVAPGGDAARLEQVVAEHLQRFGFREELLFDWVRRVDA